MTGLRALVLGLALSLVGTGNVHSQTPDDPNEGTLVEIDEVNSIGRFKWWARAGNTYFLQHSEDLMTWNWVPVVEVGDDSVKEWGFTTTSNKIFWRLKFRTGATQNPEGDDFDGDGLGNFAEVEQGLDPLRLDSDGDGLSDLMEIASGSNPVVANEPPDGSLGLLVYLKEE
jgi:hypothetical protein